MDHYSDGGTDVLLVRPYSEVHIHTPPLGLGYLASALLRERITVAVRDSLLRDVPANELISFVNSRRVKVVGVSCCTNEVPWVREFLSRVKSSTQAVTVVGGPHPSGRMEKTFDDLGGADYAVYGEGELSLPLLVKAILDHSSRSGALAVIPNLIWKDGGDARVNRPELPQDLDALDMPAWELIDPRDYAHAIPHGFIRRRGVFATMICTRGCPNGCGFCATGRVHGRALRRRSAGNLMKEIRYLHDRFGVREIFIEDDNFTFDRELVRDLCSRLIAARLGMSLSLPNGVCVDTLDEEILRLMRRAGFYSFALGIESGSPRVLAKMGKRSVPGAAARVVEAARKLGFSVTGFFILGYPGESREDIEATIRCSRRLKLDRAAFTPYMPLPGTVGYDELVRNGEIGEGQGFEAFSARDIPYSPPGIPKSELREMIGRAVRGFYLRPQIILRHIFCPSVISNVGALVRICGRFAVFPCKDGPKMVK